MGEIVGNVVVQKRGLVSLGLLKEHDIPVSDGDIFQVRLEGEKIVLVPMKLIPADQAWFWEKDWQEAEMEAEEDIAAGRVKSHTSAEDLLEDLDQ